ncbi:hypothetical protein Taro_020379 [Colocasia esculenta]|uniref:Uncharacterized protein n=1 Tax=Colocasia esculenta TaxID=4460 RepID=A0A843UW35_COLES|nr:hypothetical protein [Colocasia esculenta]
METAERIMGRPAKREQVSSTGRYQPTIRKKRPSGGVNEPTDKKPKEIRPLVSTLPDLVSTHCPSLTQKVSRSGDRLGALIVCMCTTCSAQSGRQEGDA